MLYPVIGLPPFEAGADQDSCIPLPLADTAVRFCGADGTVTPVGVLVGVGVFTGVLVGVGVFTGVFVGVGVFTGVLVGVGVGPDEPQLANLKLPIRVRQLNCETPVG